MVRCWRRRVERRGGGRSVLEVVGGTVVTGTVGAGWGTVAVGGEEQIAGGDE